MNPKLSLLFITRKLIDKIKYQHKHKYVSCDTCDGVNQFELDLQELKHADAESLERAAQDFAVHCQLPSHFSPVEINMVQAQLREAFKAGRKVS